MSDGDSLKCVVQRQSGRWLTIEGRQVLDLASCNYLGLDLDREMIESAGDLLRDWGVHPGWARMFASPACYSRLEAAVADFIGVPTVIVLPTITLVHFGAIRALASSSSAVIVDRSAHKTIYDGAKLAAADGVKLVSVDCSDVDGVDRVLKSCTEGALVCVDGVYSMTGNLPALEKLALVCRDRNATLYVDDAHGLGVLGESPTNSEPWGRRGNGCVRHVAIGYDSIRYVSGMSKAFSALCAFISCQSLEDRAVLEDRLSPYTYSGPLPISSVATSLAALRINDARGELLRQRLFRHTRRVIEACLENELDVSNSSGFPIVSIVVGVRDVAVSAARFLLREGVLVTLATHPLVPRDKCCLRISLTAAHSDGQIEYCVDKLRALREFLRSGHARC